MTANTLRFLSEHMHQRHLDPDTVEFQFTRRNPCRVVLPDRDFESLAQWARTLADARVEHNLSGFHVHGRLGAGVEIHVVVFNGDSAGAGDDVPYGPIPLGQLVWLARNQVEGAAA